MRVVCTVLTAIMLLGAAACSTAVSPSHAQNRSQVTPAR